MESWPRTNPAGKHKEHACKNQCKEIRQIMENRLKIPIQTPCMPVSLTVRVGYNIWSIYIDIILRNPPLPALDRVYLVWSVSVQAWTPKAKLLLASISRVPYRGTIYKLKFGINTMNHKVSMICILLSETPFTQEKIWVPLK